MLGLPRFINEAVEFIDLFERETLRFVDEGPHEEDGDQAAATVLC